MSLPYFGSKENHEVKISKNTSWKVLLEGNSPIPNHKGCVHAIKHSCPNRQMTFPYKSMYHYEIPTSIPYK